MNRKFSGIFKNIYYASSANLIAMSVSLVLALVIPKMLSVEEYGYFQLYLFFASYVIYFNLGMTNGIYLRYGGMYYNNLNKPLLHSQYMLLTGWVLIIFIAIGISAFFFVSDANRIFTMLCIGACGVLLNPLSLLLNLMQSTGRVKDYSKNTIAEKSIYAGIVLILFFVFKVREFQFLVLADLVAKVCAVGALAYLCRDIVFSKGIPIKDGFSEAWSNVSVGIKIMIAQLSIMLAAGIIRFSIERVWDVSIFGKVSLALTVSNLMMVFISAVGTVMFPVLKRANPDNYGETYKKLRFMLVVLVLGAMSACFPIKACLAAWLPNYAESAAYLVLLFPFSLFEGKIGLLTNNYFNVLRKEKTLLFINIAAMFVSVLAVALFIYLLKNLALAVVSIVLISAFRCILSEIIISKYIAINVFKDIFHELLLVAVFISAGWLLPGLFAFAIYAACFILYLLKERKRLSNILKMLFGE